MFTFPLTYCYPGSKLLDRRCREVSFLPFWGSMLNGCTDKKQRGFMKMLNTLKERYIAGRCLGCWRTTTEHGWKKGEPKWFVFDQEEVANTCMHPCYQLILSYPFRFSYWLRRTRKYLNNHTKPSGVWKYQNPSQYKPVSQGEGKLIVHSESSWKKGMSRCRDHLHLNTSNVLYADASWHTQMHAMQTHLHAYTNRCRQTNAE